VPSHDEIRAKHESFRRDVARSGKLPSPDRPQFALDFLSAGLIDFSLLQGELFKLLIPLNVFLFLWHLESVFFHVIHVGKQILDVSYRTVISFIFLVVFSGFFNVIRFLRPESRFLCLWHSWQLEERSCFVFFVVDLL